MHDLLVLPGVLYITKNFIFYKILDYRIQKWKERPHELMSSQMYFTGSRHAWRWYLQHLHMCLNNFSILLLVLNVLSTSVSTQCSSYKQTYLSDANFNKHTYSYWSISPSLHLILWCDIWFSRFRPDKRWPLRSYLASKGHLKCITLLLVKLHCSSSLRLCWYHLHLSELPQGWYLAKKNSQARTPPRALRHVSS